MKQQIYSTTDYSGFKFIAGNRPIIKGHLLRLSAAMAKENLLNNFPILVNKDFEIIDGQHRFLAAKNNNLELFYMVKDTATLDQTLVLNTNQRQWTLADFVYSYEQRGFEEYAKLVKFCKQHRMTTSIATVILGKAKSESETSPIRGQLKQGTWKSENWDYAEEFIDKLEELRPYFVSNLIEKDRNFITAFNMTLELVGWEAISSKLETVKPRIEREVSRRDYLRMFEDIYNWRKASTRKSFENKEPIQATV